MRTSALYNTDYVNEVHTALVSSMECMGSVGCPIPDLGFITSARWPDTQVVLTMRFAIRTIRSILQPLFAVADLDLRAARWRLDVLGARHAEVSALASLDDALGQPNARLLDLAPALVARARRATLPLLAERGAPALVHLWPGEHYRLLVAILEELKPRNVLEIGTYTGLSAVAMVPALEDGARLTTVDIIPWDRIPGSYLKHSDFADSRLRQIVCDLGQPQEAKKHAALLREADIIFIDAAKDGVLERMLLANFASVGLKPGALLVFDDIRIWNMLHIWREVAHPKLDLTSFGHWTGTGLVDWGGAAT